MHLNNGTLEEINHIYISRVVEDSQIYSLNTIYLSTRCKKQHMGMLSHVIILITQPA